MFKKTPCPNCNTLIEDTAYECPVCQRKNKENIKNKNISVIAWWKQILLFLVGYGLFQLVAYFFSFIFSSLVSSQLQVGTYAYYSLLTSYKPVAFYNFLSYLVLFPVLGLIILADSHEVFKSFKHLKPLIAGICGVCVITIFNIIYNNLLSITGMYIIDNANQSTVVNIVSQYPAFALIIFGFIGPVCEELTYRVGLFSFFNRINKILAYVVTIIIFALIHFTFDSQNIVNELLNLPLYAFAALVFSYLYDHYGLAGSCYAHIINNVISVFSSMIVLK